MDVEHVIVPLDYKSKYPYSPTGKMGAAPETNFIDPLIALTAIAAQTKKIRLGTGVNILSQTNPLLLAKQAASLDLVSERPLHARRRYRLAAGRIRCDGYAVRTSRRAFRRLRRCDEEGLVRRRRRARQRIPRLARLQELSVPVQKPHVPVIIGGAKGKIYERIATVGDGGSRRAVIRRSCRSRQTS